MQVEYAYCGYCGSEYFDEYLPFVAQYANGDFYECLKCAREISAEQIVAADVRTLLHPQD